MEKLQNYLKIPVLKGSKIPAVCGWTKDNYENNFFDENEYDTGIITGSRNNLLILDVDIKDNGINEIQKYIMLYGDINTFTISTPSGGRHYYFKYNCVDSDKNHLINEYLTNKTKYRNKGLDIRTNGGYIKAPPSKNYNIISNTEINEIDENLLLWLIEDIEIFEKDIKQTKPKNNKKMQNEPYKYNITKNKLTEILNYLDGDYSTQYNKWLLITTILKNITLNNFDTFDIFEEFSKRNKKKYNKDNNLLIWNSNSGIIDINYLIKRINKENKLNLPLIEKFKPINNNLKYDGYKVLNINAKYVNYEQEIYNNNDTIIIKSTTGSGKTSNTAKLTAEYLKNNSHLKFLSLVNLIKLSDQQIKTFKDNNLYVISYQEATNKEIKNKNIICCLNSIITKLNIISDEDIKNYIVYIDEITAFIDSLLFNDALNKELKQIYLKLMKIIKECNKLIVSDAIINNNVFNLLEKRNKKNKIFIINEYKKYKDVEAIRHNDENEFLKEIRNNINDDKYFLFGCDSKSTITKYYNTLREEFKTKTDKFLLITAETTKKINNAVEEFKNKFVFFSPSIITGLDFSISEKQNVFIYIKGNTINPASSFQQATRTRNIDKLYYYSCCKEKKEKYCNIEEVETNFKTMIETNEKLLNLSCSIDEDDEINIINNTFFKLFCEGIYQQDTEQTNKLLHFEEILINQGFKLFCDGDKNQLNKELKKQMTNEFNEIKEQKFNKYIDDTNEGEDVFLMDEHEKYLKRQILLKIDDEELKEYEFLLNDEFKLSSFFHFINLFRTTTNINECLTKNKNNNMNVKIMNDEYNKILLLRKFEIENNITPFDINFINDEQIKINIDDIEYKHLKYIFRMTKGKPTNKEELKKVYIGMLRNLISNLDIIKSKQIRVKGDKIMHYSFNEQLIKSLFNLIFRMKIKYLDENLLNKINIKLPTDYINECVIKEIHEEEKNIIYKFKGKK